MVYSRTKKKSQQNSGNVEITSETTTEERCVNPFFNRIDFKPSDYIWLIFGSIFLAPIRLILSILIFMIGSLVAKFYNFILTTFFDKEQDPDLYNSWREYMKIHLVFLLNCIFFVCGFFKTTIVQKGDLSQEKDAPIYVFAPHTSLFDIAAGLAFNAPSSVAKSDIIDIPLFGNIFKFSNPVLVDRSSRDSRQDVFKKVAETIKYCKIVFWPEGTCSNHKVLIQFKNGAFKFGYPVLPVAVRFQQFGTPDTLSWTWNGPGTFTSLWLTLCRWRTHCEIVKLPVYYPSLEEKADSDLYAENVSKVFTKELGISCLRYTFEDVKYLKYNYFHSTSCVKLVKLIDKIRNIEGNDKFVAEKKIRVSNDKLFESFLIDFLKTIRNICNGLAMEEELDYEKLYVILQIKNTSEMKDSVTMRDFMLCISEVTSARKVTILHFYIVVFLIDLSIPDLWQRLENVCEFLKNHKICLHSMVIPILWLALNLEANDKDRKILAQTKIDNFLQLKQLLLIQYDFALRENANSLSKLADKK